MAVESKDMKVNRLLWSPRVPYEERNKTFIRDMILEALKAYKNLNPAAEDYTHNNGLTVFLVQLKGTVPIRYEGSTYNIPVVMWLVEDFPRSPPVVFVTPTPRMRVAEKHPYVNPSGEVFTATLRSWERRVTALRQALDEMVAVFTQIPPLYSVPDDAPPPRPQPPVSSIPHTVVPPPSSSARPDARSGGFGYNMYGGQVVTPGGYGVPGPSQAAAGQPTLGQPSIPMYGFAPTPPQPPPMAHPSAGSLAAAVTPPSVARPPASGPTSAAAAAAQAGRRDAEGALTALLRARVAEDLSVCVGAAIEARRAQVAAAEGVFRELAGEAREADGVVAQLQAERMAVDRAAGQLQEAARGVAAWLARNERAEGASENGTAAAIAPESPLDGQLIASHAEDLAIEDALEVLDGAFEGGSLSAEEFLKRVRVLAKRQFMARATCRKISEIQRAGRAQASRS